MPDLSSEKDLWQLDDGRESVLFLKTGFHQKAQLVHRVLPKTHLANTVKYKNSKKERVNANEKQVTNNMQKT